MKSLTRTAYRAIAAFVAAAFVMIGLASPAFADGATVTITNQRTGIVYTDVATATKEATSGDTLVLGEGNYTLYNVSSTGTTRGKDLTFVGQGTDKTAWNIGALVPDPANFGTEYNGDYSFDGAGTVTFKNMTLRSGNADYLASFVPIRPSLIIVSLTARPSTGGMNQRSLNTRRSTRQLATMPLDVQLAGHDV